MILVPERECKEYVGPYDNVVREQAISEMMRLEVSPDEQQELIVSQWYRIVLQWYRSIQPGRGRRILELKGLGKEIWRGVDPKIYIDELRDEWDNP